MILFSGDGRHGWGLPVGGLGGWTQWVVRRARCVLAARPDVVTETAGTSDVAEFFDELISFDERSRRRTVKRVAIALSFALAATFHRFGGVVLRLG